MKWRILGSLYSFFVYENWDERHDLIVDEGGDVDIVSTECLCG